MRTVPHLAGTAAAATLAIGATSASPTRAQPADPPYSWQQPHARVIETGDLAWAPEAFWFVAGDSVRYIDFDRAARWPTRGRRSTSCTPWQFAGPFLRDFTGRAPAGGRRDSLGDRAGAVMARQPTVETAP